MSLELYLAFIAASVVITVIPGPTVALVVGNSLTHGTRAGLLNVAGTQLALAAMMVVLVIGLSSVVATMGWVFDWLRWAGAAYLVYLGWKMLRASGTLDSSIATPKPRGGFFLQGFLVMASNPKVLVFFGAFIPQFVSPGGDQTSQIIVLCATAMMIAAISDSLYAILTGRARALFTRRRVRILSAAGGATLIGGGIWLALTRGK
ncbi:MAG: LysE family translocator [Alphaproteobacteria bacterium]|nr:LysE family translocator [Alphaproteobacteria bacterium]